MGKTLVIESINSLAIEYELRKKWIEDLRNQAKGLSELGQYARAEETLLEILAKSADYANVWSDLAGVYCKEKQYQKALAAILRAIEIDPLAARHHYNFGLILNETENAHGVMESYRKTISGRLSSSESKDLLSNNASNSSMFLSIEAECRQSLSMRPELEGFLRLGNVLMAEHKSEEAIELYERALRLTVEDSLLARNLAFAFQIEGDHAKEALYLGYALIWEKNYREALLEFQISAKTLMPDAQLYAAMGKCYFELGEYAEASRVYRQGIEQYPRLELYIPLVETLFRAGESAEAIQIAEIAVGQSPDNFVLKFDKFLGLPVMYQSEEEIDSYRHRFANGLEELIVETRLTTYEEKRNALQLIGFSTNFHLAYQGYDDLKLQQQYGEFVYQIMAANYPEWVQPRPMPSLEAQGRIRIGYVSTKFHHHSVANTTIGWLMNRDKQRFKVYTYHLGHRQDYMTFKFRDHSDSFIHIADDLEAIAEQIIADQLHVLVFPDIGMSPLITQLAGLRLAPIQCTSWGHPVTSGIPTIDYYLSGDLMEPEKAEKHYSEKLVRLPNLGVDYEKPEMPRSRKPRSDYGIDEDAVVYLCNQSLSKFLPQHDNVFPRIAQAVPNAIFVFLSPYRQTAALFRERLKRAFAQLALRSEDYCIVLPSQDYISFLNLNLVSDVFLDTLGWSGANTTLEGVASGIPIVTVPGEFMRSRHTYAILRMLDLNESIAANKEEYIQIASTLGSDRSLRDKLRMKTLDRNYLVYDDRSCVKALEDFYAKTVSMTTS